MDKTSELIEMGSYLDSIDDVRERNDAGFNRIDKDAWPGMLERADCDELLYCLYKYRGQLIRAFGEDKAKAAGLMDGPPSKASLKIKALLTGETTVTLLSGRFQGDAFGAYVRIVKGVGASFDPSSKLWRLGDRAIPGLDVDAFETQLRAETGAEVIGLKAAVEAARTVLASRPATVAAKSGRARNTVSISRSKSGVFSISFDYDAKLVAFFSNRGGGLSGITAYNPETKARETLSMDLVDEIITKLRQQFPDWSVLTDGVDEARAERDELRRRLQAPIAEVSSKLATGIALFPYQNEGVHFLNRVEGNALVGDEMGLGKTLQVLAWAIMNKKRILVVCPKAMRRTWIEEAEKFFPGYFNPIELMSNNLKKGQYKSLKENRLAAINYESVHKFLALIIEGAFDAVIIDESHRMKNPKAKITQTLLALGTKYKHHILMSGTKVKNKKTEMFTQLQLVMPELYPTVESLRNETIGGAWNTIQKCYIARTKGEVLPYLPEKITQIVKVDGEGLPDIRRPDFSDDATGQDEEAYEENGFSIGDFARLKHTLAIAKVPSTCEFVEEILTGSEKKVLVFTDSVPAAEAIAEHFGELALLWHGSVPNERREYAKRRFQENGSPERVFVAVTASAGVGLTLTAASAVVFSDLPWTAADVRQAEDRAHRATTKHSVNVYWMVAGDNLFDEGVSQLVMRKYQLHRMLNEGKTLSPEDREWMAQPVSYHELMREIMATKKTKAKLKVS